MTSKFYRAFEDKHRGSRELVKSRCEVYLPFIKGLKEIYPEPRALDLGCGRGEWLEFLREHGIESAEGVDIDEGMFSACTDLGLNVTMRDALEHLKAQPVESLDVISAFHLVEHIPFSSLQELVEESRRVLRPAGLLIMETPNPDNLVVGSSGFYVDPTHKQPIPSALLIFLPKYYGFARQMVLGLQEPKRGRETRPVTLVNVLFDVSPDYAVVAQAPGTNEQLDTLGKVFEVVHGSTLEELAQSFDQNIEDRLNGLHERLESQVRALHHEVETLNRRTGHLEAELIAARQNAASLDQALQAVYHSVSWRITWPLRILLQAVKWVLNMLKRVMLRLLIGIMGFTTRRPGLTAFASRFLNRYPGLRTRLNEMVMADSPVSRGNDPGDPIGDRHVDLSETAHRFYRDLKAAGKQETRDKD